MSHQNVTGTARTLFTMAFNVELVALLEHLFNFRHLVPPIVRNAINCTLECDQIDEISENALNSG